MGDSNTGLPACSSRLNVQVIDRERVAEIFQIYIYCIIEYFPAPIKLSWAPWRAKYTFYERGGLVSCSFCRWNDREMEGKRKRERIKLRLLYLCSRVEWFSTFWRLSKLDKLLPIRIIFRSSIPKDQQVWPCDKILILKKIRVTLQIFLIYLHIPSFSQSKKKFKIEFCYTFFRPPKRVKLFLTRTKETKIVSLFF